jgi:hypothetical protein
MRERKDELLAVLLPRSLNEAVGKAAELNFTSKSEWARQALRRELANKGLEPLVHDGGTQE